MRIKIRQLVYNLATLLLSFLFANNLYDKYLSTTLAQNCAQRSLMSMDSNPSALFIGVMTTRANLATRAAAIMKTWGRDPSARIVFYIGGDANVNSNQSKRALHVPHRERVRLSDGIPVVQLEGISDLAYPPRGKCYAMIQHMHLNFGTRYRWFLRADDDVYIRVGLLARFVQSLDSVRPWYVGHPGFGIPEEIGRLGLEPGKPYCLGGPGVLFSAVTMALLVPHLGQCSQGAVTSHEDTELGLCMWRYLRLACTSEQKIKKLFYQNYDKQKDYSSAKKFTTSISVHPVKDPADMHRLHIGFFLARLHERETYQRRVVSAMTEMAHLTGVDAEPAKPESEELARQAFDRREDLRKFVVSRTSAVYQRMIGGDPAAYREYVKILVKEIKMANNPVWSYAVFKKQTGIINTAERTHWRTALMQNVTRDLVANTTRYHSHLLDKAEIQAQYQSYTAVHGPQHLVSLSGYGGHLSFLLRTGLQDLRWHEASHLGTDPEGSATPSPDARTQRGSAHAKTAWPPEAPPASEWPQLFVLLPLSGRHHTYLRFLGHLATAASRFPAGVQLRVALFPDPDDEHKLTLAASREETRLGVTVLEQTSQFSRAKGLNAAVSGLKDDAILVVIDVDLVMSHHFLKRAALNTVPGRAYFPIMFSQYSPSSVCYGEPGCQPSVHDLSEDAGFWRHFSYGMLAITAGDFRRVGGYDTNIEGWGKEDVEFYERYLSEGLEALRSPDDGLIHQFHGKDCDKSLPADQMEMCLGSRFALQGSLRKLIEIADDLEIPTLSDA